MIIKYRNCEYKDLELIIRLKELGMRWYIEKIYGWNIEIQREKTKREIDKFIDTMKIIVIDDKDVGVTNFFEEKGIYHVGLIIIHPDYQGKGIATKIISGYIDTARQENKDIIIKTYKDNPAKRLYERLGFKQYKEDDTHVYLCINYKKEEENMNEKIEEFVESFKENNDIEYLKKQFRNVYFIIGTAYAGKSTMIKMLSEYYDGIICEENYTGKVFKEYGVNMIEQPNLCYTDNHSMEEFVNRTPDEYYNWLRSTEMEVTPIEISELLKLTTKYPDKKIFVDTSIPMEIIKLISDFQHVAVMVCESSMSINKFFDRPDYEKNIIFQAIKKSSNPDATLLNFRKCIEKNNSQERYDYFLNSGFYVFKRDDSLTLEQTMDILAQHFKLKQKN